MITLNEFLTCVEWGFRKAENGDNLQKTLEDANELWNNSNTSLGVGLMKVNKPE